MFICILLLLKNKNENNSFQGWNHWNAITDSKSLWPIHSRTMLFAYAKRFIIFGWLNVAFLLCKNTPGSKVTNVCEPEFQRISSQMKKEKRTKTLCFSLLFRETFFMVQINS